MQIPMNPQPDGTFKVSLPEGRYRITANVYSGNSSSYSVKALSYGTTDLLKDVLVVSTADSADLRLTLARSSPGSWVKVSGRVSGLNTLASQSSVTVSLNNPSLVSSLSAVVRPDGSFEFPKVYSGNYTAHLSVPVANLGQLSVDVKVMNSDVTGVDFVIPRVKEISGRIVLEGQGAMPQLNIPLTGNSAQAAGFSPGPVQVININPQSDGTFKVTLPEGERQVTLPTELPSGYAIKAFTYGSTDLMRNPLKVTVADDAEFRLSISTPNRPPVKVSGKVTGLDANPYARGPIRVSMNALGYASSLDAVVGADGSFEFPKVFPGNYTARLSLSLPTIGPLSTNVNVAGTDVTGIEIVVPRVKEIIGRVVLESRGPMPQFTIPLVPQSVVAPNRFGSNMGYTPGSILLNVYPQADGTFRVMLPEGERSAGQPMGLPPGYAPKSLTYGSTDLMSAPMKVSAADTAELRVTLATPNLPLVKVSGKVVGFDPARFARQPVLLSLNAAGYGSSLQARVDPDGSFEFAEVFPGSYVARFMGPTPVNIPDTPVNVSSSDVKFDITLPRQKEISGRVLLEGRGPMPQFGLPLMSIPGSSPGAATAPTGGPMSQFGLLLMSIPGSGPGAAAAPTGTLNIGPQPDGSFKVNVIEGDHQVGPPSRTPMSALPAGYTLKSLTYGTTDVLNAPLKVRMTDTAELRVTLSTPNVPPVKVSGKVAGVDASMFVRGPMTVIMNTAGYPALETTVSPDGSFEFPEVFPGNYIPRVMGAGVATSPGPISPPIVVGSSDVRGVEFVVRGQKEVTGRVTVEGSAPIPRFGLRGNLTGARTALEIQTISINPLPDGMFRLMLSEGERPLGELIGLPHGYTLKSATYGTTDLLRNPLKVSRTDTAVLLLSLSGPALSPVAVSGRVSGLSDTALSQGTARAVLDSLTFAVSLNAAIQADGSFEFPAVFPGRYGAQILAPGLLPVGAPNGPVIVADAAVKDIQLTVPPQHTFSGRIAIEGGGPMLRIPLSLTAEPPEGGLPTRGIIVISPDMEGSFRLALPQGEFQVSLAQLPSGYKLKSLTYDTTDLRQAPLKITANADELRINLEKTTASPWVTVSGRVIGLASESQNVRVALTGTLALPQQTPVSADGTFTFSQVVQGSYTARLIGTIGGTPPTVATFTVGTRDVTDIELVISK
jgi:hypothetical protein